MPLTTVLQKKFIFFKKIHTPTVEKQLHDTAICLHTIYIFCPLPPHALPPSDTHAPQQALFEARAGHLGVARNVLRYLIKNIPRHGPIYHEAYKLEEKCEQFPRAADIVEKGLVANPRYGPLWFGAFRLYERVALQEQLEGPPRSGAADPAAPGPSAVDPAPAGHRHLRCLACARGPSPGDRAPSPAPASSPDRRKGRGDEASPPSSPSSSPCGSRDTSPGRSPRALDDADASISCCSSVGDCGTSACDSARSTSTSLSAGSGGVPSGPHPSAPARAASRTGTLVAVPAARAAPAGKAKEKAKAAAGAPACEHCCPHTRSLEGAAALAAEGPRPMPIDLERVRDAIQRAVKSISKELIWKVHFEHAQIEERAGCIAAARQVCVRAVLFFFVKHSP